MMELDSPHTSFYTVKLNLSHTLSHHVVVSVGVLWTPKHMSEKILVYYLKYRVIH